MTNASYAARWSAVMAGNYRTPLLTLVRGDGCWVTDADGRRYLDLVGGIAVSALGHGHPALVAAVQSQVAVLAHTSNLYANPRAVELAERLRAISGRPDARVFLCNDGTTANEAAIKTVLRHQTGRRRFVAATAAFHGRSLGALALTGKPSAREPFAPFGLDVTFVPYGDEGALVAAVDHTVAAVVLEPIQGEAGVIVPPSGYLRAARRACDRAGALLVLDEVQGGIGRTGAWFAHEHDQVAPDLVTVAKGLGGGLPVGACLAFGAAGHALQPGDHGATFGGNPVACAAALAVLDVIERDGLLAHVGALGAAWSGALAGVRAPLLRGVRGRGLWLALALDPGTAGAVEAAAREAGFLVNAATPDTIRLAPPLVLAEDEAARFTAALPEILARAAGAVSVGTAGEPAGVRGTAR